MTREDLISAWRFVRSCRPTKPERLCSFLVRMGGIKDYGRDVERLIGSTRSRPGLINFASGRSLDDAALIAWEHRYLRTVERPMIRDLLEAIEEDLSTEGVYSEHDDEQYAQWREYMIYYHTLDTMKLMSLVSLAQLIRAVDKLEADNELPSEPIESEDLAAMSESVPF